METEELNEQNGIETNESKGADKKPKHNIAIYIIILLFGVVAGAAIMGLVLAGVYLYIVGSNGSVIKYSTTQKLSLLEKAIDEYYLREDEISDEALENGMYKGLMSGLGDPYSVYYTKEEYQQLLESTTGEFEGVGVYLSQNPETMEITVVRPLDDTPCDRAGIKAGDILIKVDGEDITGTDLTVVVANVKGPEGSPVTLTFLREGKEISFDLVREKIETMTISSRMEDEEQKIGYIYIAEFDEVTSKQFKDSLNELKAQGMKSLIIDVRDNPGGSVSAVVNICDEFVNEGNIVYVEDKNKNRKEYVAEEGVDFEGPMVLITNGNSASASEILTGCLKDYGLATVIGTKTYGKGIVQTVMPLGDGTAIKITIQDYYTPNGNNIHGVGIEPDEEIELDVDAYKKDKTDNQLNRALEILRK